MSSCKYNSAKPLHSFFQALALPTYLFLLHIHSLLFYSFLPTLKNILLTLNYSLQFASSHSLPSFSDSSQHSLSASIHLPKVTNDSILSNPMSAFVFIIKTIPLISFHISSVDNVISTHS